MNAQEKALEAYDSIDVKHISTGQKVDFAMAKARVGFFHRDYSLVKAQLEIATEYELRLSN